MVLYVAETDIDGKVCCVWHKAPGLKAACPVRCFGDVRNHLDDAEYSGASAQAIYEFLVTLDDDT